MDNVSNEELVPWRTQSRRVVFDRRPYLTVESHEVVLPDGRLLEDWSWVTVPDSVELLARTEAGLFICLRQTKYAVEGTTLAPVAGMIETGEPPLVAARRELLEETGYASEDWQSLGAYPLDGNRGVRTCHFFLADHATEIGTPTDDDLEEQELLRLDEAHLRDALRRGAFKVASWVALVGLVLLYTTQ